ncbi:hypothetical protein [Streptomyces sp. NPDC049881]|uniref:hypothetical protein n=1 Tax=Streptomyces sp. NPDC049881 TaxID=3155778 RepID=UPI0034186C48
MSTAPPPPSDPDRPAPPVTGAPGAAPPSPYFPPPLPSPPSSPSAPFPAAPSFAYGWQPPVRRGTDLGLIALCLSLPAFPLGLLLGVLALVRGERGDRTGRGQAVAAIAVTGGLIAVLAVAIPAAAFDRPSRDGVTARGTGETVLLDDLVAGDCFDASLPAGETGDVDLEVTRRACDVPHMAEVVGTVAVPVDGGRSDTETVGACLPLVGPYVVDFWEVPLDAALFFYTDRVTSGGREDVLCTLELGTGDMLTAPLRGDRADFGAEQLAYLDATGPLEAEIWDQPVPGDGLSAQRAWAREMGEAVVADGAALAASEWSAPAAPAVEALVAAREAGASAWDDAAAADSQEAFEAAVVAAYDRIGIDEEWDARTALGLTLGE